MSTALTGPTAMLGIEMRTGVLAGFARCNRSGGVHGRSLDLIALDDGYEPILAAPNMHRLLEHEHVLGVIGNVGTPTAVASLPIAIEQKTLFFAPFTGAGILRRVPPDRCVFNYRASYAEETGAMIDALLDHAGLAIDQIAFFTQRDAYGDAGYFGGVAALKRHGLNDECAIVQARYERNTVAVESALAELMLATPPVRAVVMVGAYAPCAALIRAAIAAGFEPLFLNVSFVGAEALAQQLDPDTKGVIVTQVVPHPTESDLQIVREYRDDLRALDPASRESFGSLEGYIASRILVRALERVGPSPSREDLVNAFEQFGTFDIGLATPLTLDTARHQASHEVWPTILSGGRFVPFDWRSLRPRSPPATEGR